MEVNDTNLESLSRYLSRTLSPDINERRPAEQFLQTVEGNKNYSILLLHAAYSPVFDPTIRTTAAVTFKNYIKRHWVVDLDTGNDVIDAEDREQIKVFIVQLMLNSPEAVQKQLSDAIAIMGKHDFPEKWVNLLPEMIDKFSSGNFSVINGGLRTLHALFKKYQYEFKSQKLWTEIKYVLDTFAKPLTDLFVATMQLTETETNKENLLIIYNSILVICKIFYSLNYQDLPEFFEDNMNTWMAHFHTLLTKDVPALKQDANSDECGILEEIRSQICENISMYAQKYEEEFAPHLPDFVTDVWNLLSSITSETKYDNLAGNALQFLATVAEKKQYQHLFENPAVLGSICERVVIPNIEFRDTDLELFEDDPEEYIRRDIEGSDVETRRRAACDLVKVLSRYFEDRIMGIFGTYIQAMLDKYAQSKLNWRSKDAAMYLIISMATKGQTMKYGVTQTTSLVNITEFAMNYVIPELQNPNVDEVPVIIADSIKYIMSFRGLLPKEVIVASFPLFIRCLDARSVVVHTYAAAAIHRALVSTSSNAITHDELAPFLPDLIKNLLCVLSKPGSEENEYAIKAMLRTFNKSQQTAIPLLADVLPQLIRKLSDVAKNPCKPVFNHYLFENFAVCIRIVCEVSPEGVTSFESELFPIFQVIMQQDIVEFLPYVFQLLAMLLEYHRPGEIGEAYMALYPFLFSPPLWERPGNTYSLVRLLSAYIAKCEPPSDISEKLKLDSLLGVFQKLIAGKSNDHEGFELMQNLMEKYPPGLMSEQHVRSIFILLFQRLTSLKTAKYVCGLTTFLCFYACKFGVLNLISTIDNIQERMFGMVIQRLLIPGAESVYSPVGRKRICAGLIEIILSTETYGGIYFDMWPSLIKVVLPLLEKLEEVSKINEVLGEEDLEASYDAVCGKLVFASKPKSEPLQGYGDLRIFLASSLSKILSSDEKVANMYQNSLTIEEKAIMRKYAELAKVPIL